MGIFDDIKAPGPTKYKFVCGTCGNLADKPRIVGCPHRIGSDWAITVDSREAGIDYNDAAWLHEHPEHRGSTPDRLCYGQPHPKHGYGVL